VADSGLWLVSIILSSTYPGIYGGTFNSLGSELSFGSQEGTHMQRHRDRWVSLQKILQVEARQEINPVRKDEAKPFKYH
jgi:hypothetical protein